MLQFALSILAALRARFRGRRDTAPEVITLRQQVVVLKRKRLRPPMNSLDRLFWTTPFGPKTRTAQPQGHPTVTSAFDASELETASAPKIPRVTQEMPKAWTRRIRWVRQSLIADARHGCSHDFAGSGSGALVVVQHAAQTLTALHGA